MDVPVIQTKFYSADDLWVLSHSPEYDEQRLELVEGELIVMAPAGGEHGGLTMGVGAIVYNHVTQHDLGYVTAAETGYILFKNPDGKDTVHAPDVGFVRKERLPNGLPQQYIPFAPDLAVEVVSSTDSADEVHDKVNRYLKYGTQMVWVLYPKSKSAMVHTPSGSHPVDINGALDGGVVLPGFTLALKRLFPE
jgi:Uma2 family endonuclease